MSLSAFNRSIRPGTLPLEQLEKQIKAMLRVIRLNFLIIIWVRFKGF